MKIIKEIAFDWMSYHRLCDPIRNRSRVGNSLLGLFLGFIITVEVILLKKMTFSEAITCMPFSSLRHGYSDWLPVVVHYPMFVPWLWNCSSMFVLLFIIYFFCVEQGLESFSNTRSRSC